MHRRKDGSRQASNLVFWKLRALRPLGKVTKKHQGQVVVNNTLKVDNGLRASRSNPHGQAMASVALV